MRRDPAFAGEFLYIRFLRQEIIFARYIILVYNNGALA
jgi:hypothetical protein